MTLQVCIYTYGPMAHRKKSEVTPGSPQIEPLSTPRTIIPTLFTPTVLVINAPTTPTNFEA